MPPHDSTTTPLQKSSHPLHVLIIGAGPCGLSSAIAIAHAGHRVTVFESVPQLHEVGAGLQITPNGSRLLRRWGVDDALLAAETATPAWLRIQRFSGELLAQRTGYEQEVRRSYGSPLWGLHRVDLQSALARRARELGVTILLATKVVDVDFEAPAVTLVDGERVVGDLVVAADGLWSSTRSRFLGRDTTPQPTGHMAYRILVPAEQVANNEHRSWMAEPGTNIWIGPEAHAVAYSICQGKLLNVVVLVKDDLAADVKKASGNMEELKSRLSDWDPILTRYLACVEKVEKWKLYHLDPLKCWRNPSGTFVMAGDSCHPILPYMAQGANSALEDAAVLGGVLSHITHAAQLPQATQMYESIRQRRTKKLHEITFQQGEEFHLPDGPEQEERDRLLAKSFEPTDGARERWTHPKWQKWLWEYNAYEEVNKAIAANPFPTYC